MDTVYFYLFITTLLHLIGSIVFGHFEEKTPLPKRFFKIGLLIILTTVGYETAGGIGALGLSLGLLSMGLTVHFTWCRMHDIHPVTAEPRARYDELRGWN